MSQPAPSAPGKKPLILFFARGYQAEFFPELIDESYEAVFVTLTREEAARVRAKGCEVAACFEADFDRIAPAEVPPHYLKTSFVADRFLGRFDDAKRLEILGREIAFWRALFDRFEPIAVLNELVAIEISEVLLIECEARGIRYLAAMHGVTGDSFYWLPDPISLSGTRHRLPEPGPEAAAKAERYIRSMVEDAYVPFYVQDLSGRKAPRQLLGASRQLLRWKLDKDVRPSSPRFVYEDYTAEFAKRVDVYWRSFTRGYDRLKDIPADKQVVFYPLHQEPEATLNYMSEFFSDQVATIENILKCLGPHQVMVVKEHPVDKGSLLQDKFARLRDTCSALYFCPGELPGRAVLQRADIVTTLTSTVGWEAVLESKRVLVLGEIFYDAFECVEKIADFASLRRKLREDWQPDPDVLAKAKRYIGGFFEESFPGNPFPFDGLYTPENIERVKHAIRAATGLPREAP